jgi:hypothetical protein
VAGVERGSDLSLSIWDGLGHYVTLHESTKRRLTQGICRLNFERRELLFGLPDGRSMTCLSGRWV